MYTFDAGAIVKLPVLRDPFTCKVAEGVVVLIPIFPELSIRILSVKTPGNVLLLVDNISLPPLLSRAEAIDDIMFDGSLLPRHLKFIVCLPTLEAEVPIMSVWSSVELTNVFVDPDDMRFLPATISLAQVTIEVELIPKAVVKVVVESAKAPVLELPN